MTPDIHPFKNNSEKIIHRMDISKNAFQSVITYEDEHPDFRPLKHLLISENGKEYYVIEGSSTPRGQQQKTVTLRIEKESGDIAEINEKETNQKIAA